MNTVEYPASPALLSNLDRVVKVEDLTHSLKKDGAKGTYSPQPGIFVDYQWDPIDGFAKSRIRVSQEMLKDALELCQLKREYERILNAGITDGVNGETFLFWPYLDVELQARGLDYYGILASKDEDALKKVYYIVETEFPQFKLTNRSLWRRPKVITKV